jgi:D-alanyl-D-alanine carboxypeptidase/D-alanyl-D-alanine-endopeptidase (penicillin-binding protein 4)
VASPAVLAAQTPPAAATTALQRDISDILSASVFGRTYWGVFVKSLRQEDTLFALNEDKLLMPGSDMKVVTLAAAAERLGWGFGYRTSLETAGTIENGVLDGDLLVVGSGDPSIVERGGVADGVFDRWADALKERGVRLVNGRLIGDGRAFSGNTVGPGWMWDDIQEGFSAPVGALQFNENAVRLTVAPGATLGVPPSLTLSPGGHGLLVRNMLTTTGASTQAAFQARRAFGSDTLELRGNLPLGSAPFTRTVSVRNPTLFFVNTLRDALTVRGIDIRGPAVDIDDVMDPPSPGRMVELYAQQGPTLRFLAETMMKTSQNLYAETLLKTVGAMGGSPTFEGGVAEVRRIVGAWGVSPAELLQVDGSGQSRYNYVTPRALVTVLTHAQQDESTRADYLGSLPIAGVDGTLANRMRDTPAQGNVLAKTGSLANVRGLAGYVRSSNGEWFVFCILANNFDVSPDLVTKATDAIVARLARFRR